MPTPTKRGNREKTMSEEERTEVSVITYVVTEEQIQETREKYAALTADTPAGYEEVRKAIRELVSTRTAIEARRVELKAESLAYGRRVDSTARKLTELLIGIEEPLKLKKAAVDEEKDRVRREKEAAELAEIEAALRFKREAEEKAAREEQERIEAAAQAQREAEEQRLAAERERLETERAALAAERAAAAAAEAERAAAARAEREALEAAQEKLRREREAAERAEFERQAKIRAEEEARERARLAAIAAEEERVAAAERAEQARIRMEALKPERAKLLDFAGKIRALPLPTMKSKSGKAVLSEAMTLIGQALVELEEFGKEPAP